MQDQNPATQHSARAARTPGPASRRFGYLVAIAVNAVIAYLINVRPGWEALPFLTDDMRRVLGLVNLSLAASIAANVVYLVHDGPRTRALGGLVTLGIGLAVAIRMWQVFPFDVDGWRVVVRILLAVGIVGSGIALLVNLVVLVTGRDPGRRAPRS